MAVVMAPVDTLRQSLMTLASEGRVIDENLFFFAAGIEAVAGICICICIAPYIYLHQYVAAAAK